MIEDRTNHNRLAEQMAARLAVDSDYVEARVRATQAFEKQARGEVRRNPATGGWKKKGRWGAHPVLVRKAGCRVVDVNPAKPT